ncbi:hypothetical protein [Roseovarius sp. SYSU LYC5161]|uniref:hypothetical protein n=1 Tax=Roseovarius halophilus (ex Wu et al. 2025) TaxID=3376060 RepID=UPI00399B9C14
MAADGMAARAERRDEVQALAVCRAEGRDFATLFRRQYFLTRAAGCCPEGWREAVLDGWHLCHCPDLPVCRIRDGAGAEAGLFLGIGVDARGGLFAADPVVPGVAGQAGFWEAAERVIEGIAGRYVVILSDGARQRVYMDPVCDLSAVYDPVARVVASSLLPGLHRPLVRNRRVDPDAVLSGAQNYAFQHTADRHVKRMIGNHYLDLRNFCLVRHYPRGDEGFERDATALEDSCAGIVERLRAIMAALLGNYRCALPVTGGNDSRNLLACAPPEQLRGTRLFTHHVNKMSGFDFMIARQLGDLAGLPVEIIDTHAARHKPLFDTARIERVQRDREIASGYQTRGRDARTLVAEQLAPDADLLLRGNVMEILRANQYRPGQREFSLAQGLERLRVAQTVDATQAAIWGPDYMMWADTLPRNACNRIHDFQFTEQLLPNTLGGHLTAMGPQFYMNPFADRGLIRTALALPPETRRANKLNVMLVEQAWPALNAVDRTQKFKKNPENHARYDSEFR